MSQLNMLFCCLSNHCYDHCLLHSGVFSVLLMSVWMSKEAVVCFTFFHIVDILVAHIALFRQFKTLEARPWKVWSMYLAAILVYGELYFACFIVDNTAFSIDGYTNNQQAQSQDSEMAGSDFATYNNGPAILIFLYYFSTTLMSSTGFGDIAPLKAYSMFLTNCEMVLGLLYSVGIFALTLAHFQRSQENGDLELEFGESFDEEKQSENDSAQVLQKAPSAMSCHSAMLWCNRHYIFAKISSTNTFKSLFSLSVRYCLPINICVQIVTFSLWVSLPDPFNLDTYTVSTGKVIVAVLCSFLIIAQFLVVIATSLLLVDHIRTSMITARFLLESYLSTGLLFGSMYFFLFSVTPSHEFSRTKVFDLSVFEEMSVFIYFSLTTLSSTGFGDIYPRGVLARILVAIEMLISTVYGFVILGLGVSHVINILDAKARRRLVDLEHIHAA